MYHPQYKPVPSAPAMQDKETAQVLTDIYNVAPELTTTAQEAGAELLKFGLTQHRAKVCIALDISASMHNPNNFYRTNQVERLICKALSMACFFDDDYEVEVFPFGDKVYLDHQMQPFKISLTNYQGFTNQILCSCGGFKYATRYSEAIKAIQHYYFSGHNHYLQSPESAELPVFVLFVTDGDCNDDDKPRAEMCFRSASYQPIFFKFLALKGKQKEITFDFLQRIDDAEVILNKPSSVDNRKHYIDNSDLKVIKDPDQFNFKQMLEEYPAYLLEAYQDKGLLNKSPGINTNIINRINKDNRTTNKKRHCPCITM